MLRASMVFSDQAPPLRYTRFGEKGQAMSGRTNQILLDNIYASAWDTGALHEVLRDLARACRSRSAGLFHLRDGELAWEQSWNMPTDFMDDFVTNVAPRDPRVHFGLGHAPLTLMRDDEPALRRAMGKAGIDDFTRDHDLPYTVSCVLERPSPSEAVALYVSRGADEGRPDDDQVDTFSRYAPHLARAMALRRRIHADLATGSMARTRAGLDCTGVLGMDSHRHVRWMDGTSQQLLQTCEGLHMCSSRLHFERRADARNFEQLVHGLNAPRHAHALHMAMVQTHPRGWLWLRLEPNLAPCYGTDAPLLMLLRHHRDTATPISHTLNAAPTPRQLQVLALMAKGLMSKQIGHQLGIAENTVRNHIQHLLRMLDVPTRTACVARAHACGLLD